MAKREDEDDLLRSVALQNASSILIARQRAEQELIRAKEALEEKTEELAHSLSMMLATLESTTDGILVTDERGAVTGFNKRFAEMWRIPAEFMNLTEHAKLREIVSRQFEDSLKFLLRVEDIYEAAPPESFDVLELANGKVFERFSKIQSVNGRTVGRVWSFRDITERRRAEEALRDETRILELLNKAGKTLSSKLELEALVQTLTDAATELSGAQFGAFFFDAADEKGEGTLSIRLEPPLETFRNLKDLRATQLVSTILHGGGTLRYDDVMQEWPADHLPFRSCLAVPVASRFGNVVGGLFLGHGDPGVFNERTERIITGVTAQAAIAIDNARLYAAAQEAAEERKLLLERERTARTEVERASAMKDDFLATLSHELRTPLSAILGWSHMIRHGLDSQADVQRGLEIIERNARVQTQLIEDLLDMSRITSGKVRLDIQPLEPESFVEAAIETVRPAAEAKGIKLVKRLDRATGPILGDPGRLQQVVWNLLSNAIKFTPKDGKAQVVLQRVNSNVEIRVSDTGIGIKPDFLQHVFERFRQADHSATRSHGGLGLGLAIVKNLVEMHGGTVSAESSGPDDGTTFVVHLPILVVHGKDSSGRALQPASSTAFLTPFERADLSGIKVMVVDDEPDARNLIQRVLEECGAEVLTAGGAAEAVPLVERERPDVLVTDIGMPDIDGYELLRRVRMLGQAAGGKVPAVALTAFARSEDRTRALRAGFLVHIAKPVEPSELVATIASIAGRTGSP